MKTVKTNSLEFVLLEDGERLRQSMLLPRSGTSWQGQLFLESIRALNTNWPTGETDGHGGLILRMPSVAEIMERSVEIVESVVATMKAKGWSVEMMSAEDLLEEGGRPGFVVGRSHGEADQVGPALPAAKRPA